MRNSAGPDDAPDTAPGTTLGLDKATSLACGRVRPPTWSGTPPTAAEFHIKPLDRDAHGGRRDPDGGAQEDGVTDRQHGLADPGCGELRAHAREEERNREQH